MVRTSVTRTITNRLQALRRRRAGSQHGWTLIELLVVLSIIMILASMGLVQYRNSVLTAKEATLRSNLMIMRDAIDQYYADKNRYPSSLDALVSDGYLRRIPEDPFTQSTDSWVPVQSEPDTSNPNAEPGIFDVKSGSDKTSIAGTPYSEW